PVYERKPSYVPTEDGAEARTPTSVNRSISQLLARNRIKNDTSNCTEFLHAPKPRRLPVEGEDEDEEDSPITTARADAKLIDRDIMMKFDVAKNEEGPLRRTVQDKDKNHGINTEGSRAPLHSRGSEEWAHNRYLGLSERLRNLETHLAVRYVPCEPATLLVRLQLLEDHVISLEREYPPWAALFFHQPRRGWPPPPRSTPVIVQSHLTSDSTRLKDSQALSDTNFSGAADIAASLDPKGKGRAKSSLHRAVLDKLEVQRAMVGIKGRGSEMDCA
ncbi:hypothetical protein K488DRAFT_53147, partial [Vararia minispora EC-137]